MRDKQRLDAGGAVEVLRVIVRFADGLQGAGNSFPGVRFLVLLGVVEFKASGVEAFDQRHIQNVDPDDGLLSVVAVVVPCAGRRQDEVAAFHPQLFAFDHGEAAVAVEDEAAR